MSKFVRSLVIMFLFVFFIISLGVCVQGAESVVPTIAVENVSGKAGEKVQVPVVISKNPGICSAIISISYGDGLELISVKDGKLLENPLHGGDYNSNPFLLSWDDSLATEDTTEDGTLAILHFRINKNAETEDCGIAVSYEADNIFNLELENVHFETVNGQVEISDDASIIWLIVSVLAVTLLVAGAVVAVVVIKRKKAVPVATVSDEGEVK